MHFLSPYFFLLFFIIPPLVYFYTKNKKNNLVAINFSRVSVSKVLKNKSSFKALDIPFYLLIASLIFLIIALARPVKLKYRGDYNGKGIYIALVVDVSPSMLGEDISPTRIESSKKTIIEFIKKREFDKISIVTFALRPSVLSPLTLDYQSLIEKVESIDIDEEGSTSIGLGIVTAVDTLRNADKESEKVIILLTDGENNAGEIEPEYAAEIASMFNIKIYTIGLGEAGSSYVWVTYNDPVYGKRRVKMPFTLNEDTLISIAGQTGGRYFNAKNSFALKNIYNIISRIEKKPIKDDTAAAYKDLFAPFLLFALFLFLLSTILKYTKYLIIP